MKKAAMFGLDARIALAIFGALSVISGAALYSAIQQAKITAIITEANELGKAITQYYLDTGSLPPHSSSNSSRDLSGAALKAAPSGVSGWNGPYYPFTTASSEIFKSSQGYNITIPYREDATWASSSAGTCRTTSASCYVYIWMNIADASIKQALEEEIDGNKTTAAENLEGNFRYYSSGCMIKLDIHYNPALAAT